MSIILPIASAVLQAGSVTLDKIILNLKKITYKTYVGVSFPLILLINLIAFFIFSPPISPEMFSTKLILLILVSSIIAIIGNFLFYRALDSDCLNEMETISLLSNIPLIIFTSLFFISERNPIIIGLALVSSLFIIWSHWNHNKFQISKLTLSFLIFTVLISPFRGVIAKILLASWNPISLQVATSIIPAFFFLFYFSKNIEKTSSKAWLLLIATNILTSIAWILYFFSYQQLGVIYTVLIFSLQPLLVYFAAIFIIKEKLHPKKLIAFLIVLVSIIAAQMIR